MLMRYPVAKNPVRWHPARHGGGFGGAFLLRSLLDPWHGLHPP